MAVKETNMFEMNSARALARRFRCFCTRYNCMHFSVYLEGYLSFTQLFCEFCISP